MLSKSKKPKTVDEFIRISPKGAQERLRKIADAVRKVAPGAREEIKWGMPAFSYKRILVMFAPFKRHIGFFPTPKALSAFRKDFAKYKTGKGSIQFPYDKSLPLPLIRKMTKFRVKESIERDGKWKEVAERQARRLPDRKG